MKFFNRKSQATPNSQPGPVNPPEQLGDINIAMAESIRGGMLESIISNPAEIVGATDKLQASSAAMSSALFKRFNSISVTWVKKAIMHVPGLKDKDSFFGARDGVDKTTQAINEAREQFDIDNIRYLSGLQEIQVDQITEYEQLLIEGINEEDLKQRFKDARLPVPQVPFSFLRAKGNVKQLINKERSQEAEDWYTNNGSNYTFITDLDAKFGSNGFDIDNPEHVTFVLNAMRVERALDIFNKLSKDQKENFIKEWLEKDKNKFDPDNNIADAEEVRKGLDGYIKTFRGCQVQQGIDGAATKKVDDMGKLRKGFHKKLRWVGEGSAPVRILKGIVVIGGGTAVVGAAVALGAGAAGATGAAAIMATAMYKGLKTIVIGKEQQTARLAEHADSRVYDGDIDAETKKAHQFSRRRMGALAAGVVAGSFAFAIADVDGGAGGGSDGSTGGTVEAEGDSQDGDTTTSQELSDAVARILGEDSQTPGGSSSEIGSPQNKVGIDLKALQDVLSTPEGTEELKEAVNNEIAEGLDPAADLNDDGIADTLSIVDSTEVMANSITDQSFDVPSGGSIIESMQKVAEANGVTLSDEDAYLTYIEAAKVTPPEDFLIGGPAENTYIISDNMNNTGVPNIGISEPGDGYKFSPQVSKLLAAKFVTLK